MSTCLDRFYFLVNALDQRMKQCSALHSIRPNSDFIKRAIHSLISTNGNKNESYQVITYLNICIVQLMKFVDEE